MMKNILVVDDSATSRMLFRIYMPKDIECEIHEAEDVESALEISADINPDLVVTDYSMPVKNGVELVEALKAQGVTATFVLLTANTQKSVIEAAEAAGISKVLDKPLTEEKIAMFMRELG